MPPKPPQIPPTATRQVEVLAFPDVQLLDAAGPVQAFSDASSWAAKPHMAPPYEIGAIAPEGVQIPATSGLMFLTERLPDPAEPLDTSILAGAQCVTMGRSFMRLQGVSPQDYRQRFGRSWARE